MATTWEIHDGQQQVGPLDEEHVLRMIAAGLAEGSLVRPSGTAQWVALRSHAPFAMALERASFVEVDQDVEEPAAPTRAATKAPTHGVPAKTTPSTIAAAVLFGVCLFGTLIYMSTPHPSGTTATVVLPATKPPVAEQPKAPGVVDIIMTKTAAREAFTVARPMMIERPGDTSVGSFLFALWSLKHLRWSDVSVTDDETSFARVKKDVDAERGKRLCISGQLVQIEAHKQEYGTLYDGLLLSPSGNLYRFSAVKSSGDLVQESAGRFCGYVTGTFDYSNSAGGAGHAVDMVGMFDLPENKK